MTGWEVPQSRAPLERITCTLTNLPVAPGFYMMNLSVADADHYLDQIESAIEITIIERDVYHTGYKVTRDYGFHLRQRKLGIAPEAETAK